MGRAFSDQGRASPSRSRRPGPGSPLELSLPRSPSSPLPGRDQLERLYNDAKSLGHHPLGFSEDHLSSGAALARKFQEKAAAPDNSAAATFKSHMERVDEFKSLFLASRAAYRQMEEDNARKFKPGDGH